MPGGRGAFTAREVFTPASLSLYTPREVHERVKARARLAPLVSPRLPEVVHYFQRVGAEDEMMDRLMMERYAAQATERYAAQRTQLEQMARRGPPTLGLSTRALMDALDAHPATAPRGKQAH